MNSKVNQITKFSVFLIIFILFIALLYLLIGYPNSYSSDKALAQGYIIGGAGGGNEERLYEFLDHIEQKQPDDIRIASYGKEGQLTFIDLSYNGQTIRYQAKEHKIFGKVRQGEYTGIMKDTNQKLTNYTLTDETGSYEDRWFYQSVSR